MPRKSASVPADLAAAVAAAAAATTPVSIDDFPRPSPEHFPLGEECFVNLFNGKYIGVRQFCSYGGPRLYATQTGICFTAVLWGELLSMKTAVTEGVQGTAPLQLQLSPYIHIEVLPELLGPPAITIRRHQVGSITLNWGQWEALLVWLPMLLEKACNTTLNK